MTDRRTWLAVLCLAAASAACKHAYVVEDRDTPVHVWVEATEAAQADVAVDCLIYVGDRKVVDGPVRFPKGQTRVELPPVYMPAGERLVSVVVAGGKTASQATATIRHATWILVTLRGRSADIAVSDREPGSPK